MPFTWVMDAPTGTWKSHAMSAAIYNQSLAASVFADFLIPENALGKHKGESVTLTRVNALSEPTSVVLGENDLVPIDTMAISARSITIQEIGRGVEYTGLVEDLSEININNTVQKALTNQLRLAMDTLAATAYKSTLIKYAPTGASANNIATSGTFGAQASANLNLWHVEQIRDYMYDTLVIPPINGDEYVAVCRSLGIRGIKNDTNWIDWVKYTSPEKKFNGEVGMIEKIRFVETNHSNALGKVGANSVLGESIFFGDDAVALVEAVSPELRAGIPGNFGRFKTVAWIGELAMALIWNTANAGQAKVVHVGSA